MTTTVAMATTSCRSAKWEISGSALGRASKSALGNRSAPGGAQEGVLPRVLNVERQQEEHPWEHSLEHPGFP